MRNLPGWGVAGLAACLSTAPADAVPEDTLPSAEPTSAWLSDVVLSSADFPDGVESESAYAQFLQRRTEELVRAADTAADGKPKLQGRLVAANWILSRQMEPVLTRTILGLSTAADASSGAAAAALGTRQIAEARLAIEGMADNGAEGDDAAGAEHVLDVLERFALALTALVDGRSGEEARTAQRRAAAGLGVLLEDEDRRIAAAATLWQAALFARLEALDRARELLPLPLVAPARDGRRLDFFARLLRVQFRVREQGYGAAAVLLLKIEERSAEWFNSATRRPEAARTAALLRADAMRQWRASLGGSELEKERGWCTQQLSRIHDEYFADANQRTVMRLGYAVPLLVEIPPSPPLPVDSSMTPDDAAGGEPGTANHAAPDAPAGADATSPGAENEGDEGMTTEDNDPSTAGPDGKGNSDSGPQ